jgi:membrane protease YdiL (CAAX protease family)
MRPLPQTSKTNWAMFIGLVRRCPLSSYFGLTFALSALALAVVSAWPDSALAVFPAMVIGVGVVGSALTAATAGRNGLRNLRSRLMDWQIGMWVLALAIPPVGILLVLEVLQRVVSPSLAPQFLVYGFAAGAVTGLLEEIGWTGFAYPRMHKRFGPLGGAVLLGILWGIWHVPVVDFLGAASPHGPYLPAFLASFDTLVTALRVLIAWVYANTGSILIAQLLHASSTGFLVVLSPPRVSPAQESLWYLANAVFLWLMVGLAVAIYGPRLAKTDLKGVVFGASGA